MLTFIHLSDIHFSAHDDKSQFDLNQQIRKAMLEDLESLTGSIPTITSFDGLLITGDIAYFGQTDNYTVAKAFLEEVYGRTKLTMSQTYIVPGNHDVDRDHLDPRFPLWASHDEIRRKADPVHWRDNIETQLKKDPSQLLLSPFHAYNDFAQGYNCQTTAQQLAWQALFPKLLEKGFEIHLCGLNSALISDGGDKAGNLLVSEFQTSKLEKRAGAINIVMSHHPPEWLMDKESVRAAIKHFAVIALFGHEHSVRLDYDDKQVRLTAGALQPERDAPGWSPTYHILQLAIEGEDDKPRLKVIVHTRELHDYKFRVWRDEDEKTVFERTFAVTPQSVQLAKPSELSAPSAIAVDHAPMEQTGQNLPPNVSVVAAKRELRAYFFRLPTPQRYAAAFKAGLLRDGDDALDPQMMWAEVFRRAEQEDALAEFWVSVAALTPEMRGILNPFKGDKSA